MARYNMAHCKAEWRLFPVAQARDVPVIAFTSTRWNSLQKGHPRWTSSDPPSTATCMNWSLSHPAVQVVLNSAPDVKYLGEWADELSEKGSLGTLVGHTIARGPISQGARPTSARSRLISARSRLGAPVVSPIVGVDGRGAARHDQPLA